MTVFLKYDRKYAVNREKFLLETTGKDGKILYNVEGTYIRLEDLIEASPPHLRDTVSRFVYNVKNRFLPENINFKWRRNK